MHAFANALISRFLPIANHRVVSPTPVHGALPRSPCVCKLRSSCVGELRRRRIIRANRREESRAFHTNSSAQKLRRMYDSAAFWTSVGKGSPGAKYHMCTRGDGLLVVVCVFPRVATVVSGANTLPCQHNILYVHLLLACLQPKYDTGSQWFATGRQNNVQSSCTLQSGLLHAIDISSTVHIYINMVANK